MLARSQQQEGEPGSEWARRWKWEREWARGLRAEGETARAEERRMAEEAEHRPQGQQAVAAAEEEEEEEGETEAEPARP